MIKMDASQKERVEKVLRECIAGFRAEGKVCREKLAKLGVSAAFHSDFLSIMESLGFTSFEEEFDNAGWTYVVEFS